MYSSGAQFLFRVEVMMITIPRHVATSQIAKDPTEGTSPLRVSYFPTIIPLTFVVVRQAKVRLHLLYWWTDIGKTCRLPRFRWYSPFE